MPVKQYVKRVLRRFRSEPNVDRRKRKPPLSAVPDLAGHHFLFIGGLHRSGTSILHRLLRSSPQAAGITDAGVPEDEGQFLQSIFPTGREMGEEGRFAVSPMAHLTEESELATPYSRDTLLREWGAYYDLDKPVYLEKSPPNIAKSRFLQALFPGARFVFIVRHPVASSLATLKWANVSLIEVLTHWTLAHRILLGDLAHLEHYLVFRYEDFVGDPQFYIDEVCKFAGLDPIELAETVENHNPTYFSQWAEARRFEDRMLRDYFAENLAVYGEFGYSIDPPWVKPVEARFLARSNSGS